MVMREDDCVRREENRCLEYLPRMHECCVERAGGYEEMPDGLTPCVERKHHNTLYRWIEPLCCLHRRLPVSKHFIGVIKIHQRRRQRAFTKARHFPFSSTSPSPRLLVSDEVSEVELRLHAHGASSGFGFRTSSSASRTISTTVRTTG